MFSFNFFDKNHQGGVVLLVEFSIYLLSGAVVGFFAGLLGIGGGLILVPLLTSVFAYFLETPYLVHIAIGTSLSTIVVTSISSMKAHHGYQAVRWDIFKRFVFGIFIGGMTGASIAQFMDASVLSKTFAVLELIIAIKLLVDYQPNPNRRLPNEVGCFMASGLIGTFSSILGTGGGALNTPYLVWHNISIKQAIATSSALSLPVSVAGMLGFIWSGWGLDNLPSYSTGYIYWPAFLGIVVTSYFMAPIGAKLTHRLAVKSIKRVFAGLLILLAMKMFLF